MAENNVANPTPEDTEELHRPNPSRDRVLARLWEIAHLDPEITHGNVFGQVKALSLIIPVEGLIPDRRGVSAQNISAPSRVNVDIYEAEWLRNPRAGKNVDPEPTPPSTQEETAVTKPTLVATPVNPAPTAALAPRVPMADHFAPDTRVPFSIKRNPWGPRR
jgi:hypothetical protein